MFVAAETGGHLRAYRVGVLLRHGLMAAHAIAMRRRLMIAMLEAEVLPREPCALSRVCSSMASQTRSRVVRLGVATATRRLGGQVQRLDVARRRHPLVTVDAVDPVGGMCAVFERMRGVVGLEPKHACAGGPSERGNCGKGDRGFHGEPQVRDTRASRLAS